MTEQINEQAKVNSTSTILDAVTAIGAIGGAAASLLTQQVALAATPLALSVIVHVFNRRQSLQQMEQHYQQMILLQNQHIVDTQSQLKTLSENFTQYQGESRTALTQQAESHAVQFESLLVKIQELQTQTSELNSLTSNLNQWLQSLESQHQQLANVVGEMRQIENYSQALRVRNNSAAQIYYQRGQSHQRLGDKTGAVADYTEAIRLAPNYAPAYHNRGVLYAELNQRRAAVEDLRRAAKLYFEQGEIESYQQARDLSKEFYDLHEELLELQTQGADSSKEETSNGHSENSISLGNLFN